MVATPDLNLLVLRSVDVRATRELYEAIGLVFLDEQHGNGPRHCSATLSGGLVIEIYPTNESIPTEKTRLGFFVDELGTVLRAVLAAGAVEISLDAPLGAVVEDLDGRRIELRQATR